MSKVTIKYGKKKHKNVAIKATDSFEDIQGIIFSLTQLSPDRQKIIVGGKKVENDEDVKKLIKNKSFITVMGSNVNKSTVSSGASIKFVEEMSEAEKQKAFAELPPGLHNLGNTCYLNACIQCVKSVNELREYLKTYASNNMDTNSVAAKLGQLMIKLDSNSDAVVPQQFVQYFRGAFPRFASRNEHGIWEQQDADEAYTEILSALRQDNALSVTQNDDEKVNVVNSLFEGQFETKTVCTESEEEPESNVTEKFVKLQCFIDGDSRHINDGIKKGFTENVEKNSSKLGRNAIWKKTKSISVLPKYIPIQLVRFFWKQKTQKNAKILRKIIFPIEKLDVYDFCSQELKASIEKYRKLKLEQEDKEREKRQAVKKSEDAEKDKEKGKDKAQEEEQKVDDKMDVDEEQKIDEMDLETGYYELCGIVTHKGRSANSGHYIGYSKDTARGMWLKFDDEDVTEIKAEDVKQLYGGGDHQMAFLCIFRKIEPNLTSK